MLVRAIQKLLLKTSVCGCLSLAFIAQFVCANANLKEDTARIDEYIKFITAYDDYLGPIGNHKKGEIEIILDPKMISEVEKETKSLMIKRGISENDAASWSQVGVIQGGTNWLWIRDAVILPSGRKTIKDRLSWKSAVDGPQKVAILPVLQDKRVVVCLKYKHAMRSWQIEIPKCIRLYGETAEHAAKRELRIETGFLVKDQLYLGSIATESSSLNTLIPVFLGNIKDQVEHENNDEKAILGFLVLTKDEVKEALLKGYIELKMQGEVKKVSVNDANLSFAILQAEMRGLI